jgi:hypothetical protein
LGSKVAGLVGLGTKDDVLGVVLWRDSGDVTVFKGEEDTKRDRGEESEGSTKRNRMSTECPSRAESDGKSQQNEGEGIRLTPSS